MAEQQGEASQRGVTKPPLQMLDQPYSVPSPTFHQSFPQSSAPSAEPFPPQISFPAQTSAQPPGAVSPQTFPAPSQFYGPPQTSVQLPFAVSPQPLPAASQFSAPPQSFPLAPHGVHDSWSSPEQNLRCASQWPGLPYASQPRQQPQASFPTHVQENWFSSHQPQSYYGSSQSSVPSAPPYAYYGTLHPGYAQASYYAAPKPDYDANAHSSFGQASYGQPNCGPPMLGFDGHSGAQPVPWAQSWAGRQGPETSRGYYDNGYQQGYGASQGLLYQPGALLDAGLGSLHQPPSSSSNAVQLLGAFAPVSSAAPTSAGLDPAPTPYGTATTRLTQALQKVSPASATPMDASLTQPGLPYSAASFGASAGPDGASDLSFLSQSFMEELAGAAGSDGAAWQELGFAPNVPSPPRPQKRQSHKRKVRLHSSSPPPPPLPKLRTTRNSRGERSSHWEELCSSTTSPCATDKPVSTPSTPKGAQPKSHTAQTSTPQNLPAQPSAQTSPKGKKGLCAKEVRKRPGRPPKSVERRIEAVVSAVVRARPQREMARHQEYTFQEEEPAKKKPKKGRKVMPGSAKTSLTSLSGAKKRKSKASSLCDEKAKGLGGGSSSALRPNEKAKGLGGGSSSALRPDEKAKGLGVGSSSALRTDEKAKGLGVGSSFALRTDEKAKGLGVGSSFALCTDEKAKGLGVGSSTALPTDEKRKVGSSTTLRTGEKAKGRGVGSSSALCTDEKAKGLGVGSSTALPTDEKRKVGSSTTLRTGEKAQGRGVGSSSDPIALKPKAKASGGTGSASRPISPSSSVELLEELGGGRTEDLKEPQSVAQTDPHSKDEKDIATGNRLFIKGRTFSSVQGASSLCGPFFLTQDQIDMLKK